jgi:hypothetical protein
MTPPTAQCFSDYVVYVDESGDHGLKSMDKTYPMFVLAFCVFQKREYATVITPKLQEFKFRYFGHDMVVLHEHEIRKPKGPFTILFDAEIREQFMMDLNTIISEADFKIVATSIRKDDFVKKHGDADNLYNVAVRSCLKRLYQFLDSEDQSRCITNIIFEQRGQQEDNELELEFRRVCDQENPTGVPLPFSIVLANKQINSCGLQLADLVARPIGRKQLNPEQVNRAYDLLETKFLRNAEGGVGGAGLESYP